MIKITYEQSVELTREVLALPLGDWTHMLEDKPVRLVRRCIVGEHEIVFFRASDYCGRWIAKRFDCDAKPILYEQLSLW